MSEKTTPAPAMKVGDRVALVSRRFERLIRETTITRETPRFWWVGDIRYRKPTGAAFSDYAHEDRAIVPLDSVLPAKPDASGAATRKHAVDGLIADMQAPEIRAAPIGPITAEELAEVERLTGGALRHWKPEELTRAKQLLRRFALAYRATVDAHREVTAQRDALAAKVESLLTRCDALEALVETMITEADAHRDGVKTDRSSTAALASERLWNAAEDARKALKGARS